MKRQTAGALVILAGLAADPALAATAGTSYAGLQYAWMTYDADVDIGNDRYSRDLKPEALIGRIGYFATDYFSLEARLGKGVTEGDTDGPANMTVTTKVDYLYGIYGVGHLPLADRFSLYALVGYTGVETKAEEDFLGTSGKVDDSGFSYGVGAQVEVTPTIAGSLEYMSYLNDESGDQYSYDVTAVSAGLDFRF